MESVPAVTLREDAGVPPDAWGQASTEGRCHPRCPTHLRAEKQTGGSLLRREQIWGQPQAGDVPLQRAVFPPSFTGLGDNALRQTILGRMRLILASYGWERKGRSDASPGVRLPQSVAAGSLLPSLFTC